jgi:quinol monooxygenase YgiN
VDLFADAYGAHVVIVIGSVTAREDTVDHVVALSLEHVRRSRLEPGCLLHSVHRDAEDSRRLVFIEHWADVDALRRHFAVPASGAFVTEAAALADGPTELEIYDASPTSL